ncbi:MAG TPA: SDR family NAD(P)-dependent oxidoreductase [Rubrobacter sp.]|nr:SDR family NAD(P)-dependent oxidoreductase [Rubrobacter sp.]
MTGGDSGIGRAVALAFAREGADVVISYLEDEEPDAEEAAQAVEDSGRKAVRVPGDVAEEAQCHQRSRYPGLPAFTGPASLLGHQRRHHHLH